MNYNINTRSKTNLEKNKSIEVIELKSDESSGVYIKKKIKINHGINKNVKGSKKQDKKQESKKNKLNAKIITSNINNNKIQEENTDNNKINNNDLQNQSILSLSNQSESGNFNQVLFDYKNYEDNQQNPIKRKNDLEIDIKVTKNEKEYIPKQKKKGWIIKDSNKSSQTIQQNENNSKNKLLLGIINEEKNEDSLNKKLNNENKNKEKSISVSINENKIQTNKKENNNDNNLNNLIADDKDIKKVSQQDSFDLDFNSNVESKDKIYNFNNNLTINQKNDKETLSKYQEYLKYKNNKIKNESNSNPKLNNENNNNYELEIKTLEDNKIYDEFYKMKINNKKNNKNDELKNLISNEENCISPENSRLKKEREKMKGHKCELCQKFYECVNEDGVDTLCQECSRHRTDGPVNKTPQSFYDLSI